MRTCLSFGKKKIDGALKTIDTSPHLGVNKAWIAHHLLLQQIRWVLMIYEIPYSNVESIEGCYARHLRKWFGLSQVIPWVALFSKNSPCPLPLTGLTTFFESSKASCLLHLQYSKDHIVASSCSCIDTCTKWKVCDEIEDAESILHFKKIIGHTQTGTSGLGYIPYNAVPAKGSKGYRKVVTDTVAQEHITKPYYCPTICAEGKCLHLNWLDWSNYIKNDLAWLFTKTGKGHDEEFELSCTQSFLLHLDCKEQ